MRRQLCEVFSQKSRIELINNRKGKNSWQKIGRFYIIQEKVLLGYIVLMTIPNQHKNLLIFSLNRLILTSDLWYAAQSSVQNHTIHTKGTRKVLQYDIAIWRRILLAGTSTLTAVANVILPLLAKILKTTKWHPPKCSYTLFYQWLHLQTLLQQLHILFLQM